MSALANRSGFFGVFPILAALVLGVITLTDFSQPVFALHLESVTECGTPTGVTLFAGQTIESGIVTVANDDDFLYVTFITTITTNAWLLSETHLHVADSLAGIPQTKKGNPKVGAFAYQTTHDPEAIEYPNVIAKADLNLDENNNSLVIAAHAVVVKYDDAGNQIANETGWADGERFVDRGSGWAETIWCSKEMGCVMSKRNNIRKSALHKGSPVLRSHNRGVKSAAPKGLGFGAGNSSPH